MPTSASDRQGSEMFYMENGERRDADILNPILAEGDEQHASAIGKRIAARVLEDAEFLALYGEARTPYLYPKTADDQ
jgi:hypothetical protein